MTLAPYENLKGFATSRPPLVVFMVCLGAFAIVLLTLSCYVKVHEAPNRDMSRDWNIFLQNFAELEFCITGNDTEFSVTTASPSTSTKATTRATTQATTNVAESSATANSQPTEEGTKNYSVSLLLYIQPTRSFLSIPHNVTHVAATIHGSDMGLTGPAAEEAINITAELPNDWNATRCSSTYGCEVVKMFTCVHFQASTSVFPTSQSPPMCETTNETGVDYHARMAAYKPKVMYTPKPSFTAYFCQSRPTVKVHYTFNPTLTVWLSLHDRSVINLHLMHTSYFLFVMTVTLFCYAVIRGRPYKTKITQTDEYRPVSISSGV